MEAEVSSSAARRSRDGRAQDYRGRFHARDVRSTRSAGTLGRVVDGVDDLRRACREEIKAGAQSSRSWRMAASRRRPTRSRSSDSRRMRSRQPSRRLARGHLRAAHLLHRRVYPPRCGTRRQVDRAWQTHLGPERPAGEGEGGLRGAHQRHVRFISLRKVRPTACRPHPSPRSRTSRGRAWMLANLPRRRCDDGLRIGPPGRNAPPPVGSSSCSADEVLPAVEAIRSATINAAKVVRQERTLGLVAPGAHADLIVIDGDPLRTSRASPGRGAGCRRS